MFTMVSPMTRCYSFGPLLTVYYEVRYLNNFKIEILTLKLFNNNFYDSYPFFGIWFSDCTGI